MRFFGTRRAIFQTIFGVVSTVVPLINDLLFQDGAVFTQLTDDLGDVLTEVTV